MLGSLFLQIESGGFMKFPTKEKMRAVGINPHALATLGPGRVYISWSPMEIGRLSRVAMYQVIHLDHKTDPKGHWSDYGHKTFSIFRDTKEQALAAAIAWADEKYGKREWIRSPWGDYHESAVLPAVIEKVKKGY